jgi:hypothetical protein
MERCESIHDSLDGMSMIPVSACAYRHTSDIDATGQTDSNDWDRIANICVTRATTALVVPTGTYNELHCYHISNIFQSMLGTHRTIRVILEKSSGASDAVDVLALARLQLEGLYAVCLMLEGPEYVDCYLQDYWHKLYVRFLLLREECKLLPRWDEYLRNTPLVINAQRTLAGVTETQQWTVEHEELGTPMPAGVAPQRIPKFPTPGVVIRKVGDPAKQKMLERLHPEYVRLCSFAHGLAEATFIKQMFDKRSSFQNLLSDGQRRETFDKTVIANAFVMSFLCILQSTAELTVMYPNNIDLPEIAIKGWNSLTKASLLSRAIWSIRTRQLFGVVA